MFGSVKEFSRSESGSASTEWIVAIGIVVMMGIPVLAVVGEGSEQASDDMIVSIKDTDSFGGDGFHGGEGGVALASGDVDYVPGADMGIGFPTDEEVTLAMATRESRPVFTSASDDIRRRDKPFSNGPGGGGIAITSNSDNTPRAVPKTPRLMEQRLAMGPDQCVEDVVAEVDENLNDPVTVVASGR